jgi:hypothetical protein
VKGILYLWYAMVVYSSQPGRLATVVPHTHSSNFKGAQRLPPGYWVPLSPPRAPGSGDSSQRVERPFRLDKALGSMAFLDGARAVPGQRLQDDFERTRLSSPCRPGSPFVARFRDGQVAQIRSRWRAPDGLDPPPKGAAHTTTRRSGDAHVGIRYPTQISSGATWRAEGLVVRCRSAAAVMSTVRGGRSRSRCPR